MVSQKTIKTIRDPKTYAIIGAAMVVHRELGPGFLEAVYQEAMAIELSDREIPFQREYPLKIYFKTKLLKTVYRADFLCYDSIVVETKAQSQLTAIDEAQLIHYLKSTRKEIGLLLNFCSSSLQYRRYVCSQNKSALSAKSAVPPVSEQE